MENPHPDAIRGGCRLSESGANCGAPPQHDSDKSAKISRAGGNVPLVR
jgi:hypothetical protein